MYTSILISFFLYKNFFCQCFSWLKKFKKKSMMLLNMTANMENSAVATGLKKSVFIPIPKKGNAKECSNYHTIALFSHACKVMLKILLARQQYKNWGLTDVLTEFRIVKGTRDQIANICWFIEKARESQKNIYFCFTDYAKAFNCVDHNKLENFYFFILFLWKIFKEMGISDHLTCLLRNLYAGQEGTVRTRHRTTNWFKNSITFWQLVELIA